MHGVHAICDCITVRLSDRKERCAFWESAANDAVSVFIGTTFTRSIWVAIIDFTGIVQHGLIVGKLRAIINGNRAECTFWESRHGRGQRRDYGGSCFIAQFTNDFIASLTLSQNQQRLLLTFANNQIHFPMTERRTVINKFGTALNGNAPGSMSGFHPVIVTFFVARLHKQIFICDLWNITMVNIAVQSRSGDSPLPFCFHIANNGIGRFTIFDTICNRICIVIAFTKFDRRTFCRCLKSSIVLGNRSGIPGNIDIVFAYKISYQTPQAETESKSTIILDPLGVPLLTSVDPYEAETGTIRVNTIAKTIESDIIFFNKRITTKRRNKNEKHYTFIILATLH